MIEDTESLFVGTRWNLDAFAVKPDHHEDQLVGLLEAQ
jgi:hypothetical protein